MRTGQLTSGILSIFCIYEHRSISLDYGIRNFIDILCNTQYNTLYMSNQYERFTGYITLKPESIGLCKTTARN